MPQEFEGDLAESVFWGADLHGSLFRDVDLTGTRISHAWLVDVEIDALIDRLVINGVDVTEYVNERDPWHPLRAMIRPTTPDGMRAAWAALEERWQETIARAAALSEDALQRRVDDEFSFVQTVRHLVFAMDKWFTAPVLGEPLHPLGLPNTGSLDYPFPGLDLAATRSSAEMLAVRRQRAERFGQYLGVLTDDDLTRVVEVMENGPNPVRECLYTVFEEEFWHLRYAERDLAVLEAGR